MIDPRDVLREGIRVEGGDLPSRKEIEPNRRLPQRSGSPLVGIEATAMSIHATPRSSCVTAGLVGSCARIGINPSMSLKSHGYTEVQ